MTIIIMNDDSSSSTTLSSSSNTSTYSPPSQHSFQFTQQQTSPPSTRSTIIENSSMDLSPSSMNATDGARIYEKNVPYVNFYCRSNTSSEITEERVIYLDKPCKIGRSVAKIKPEVNNAIFDCKVLSRNHALLWYENSKVIISSIMIISIKS